jgi:RNA polymerase sigma factor (sigma-70 family)
MGRPPTGSPESDARIGATTSARPPLSEVYERERLNLVRLAAVLTQDRDEAEDVVQDAFVAVQRHWATLSDPTRALGYLRVAVINGARSWNRRVALFRRHALDEAALAPAADTPVLLREEYQRVVSAVRRLPRRQQQVVALRYWAQMPDGEIAAALEISEVTVRSNVSRALSALARNLEVNE